MTDHQSNERNLEIELDRLVDGELTPQEYRGLLTSLDQQSDGWRRCAMAFLEAQALSKELVPPAVGTFEPPPEQPVAAPGVPQNQPTNTRHPQPRGSWPIYLAIAASFLLMLGLGSYLGDYWPGARSIRPFQVERSTPDHIDPTQLGGQQPAGSVQLAVNRNGGGPQDQIELPVYDLQDWDSDLVTNQPTQLPQELEQQVRRLGLRMETRRQLEQFVTAEGYRVLVPIEQIDFVPVKNRTFQ